MLRAGYTTRNIYDREAKRLKVHYRTGCTVNRVLMIRICSKKSLDCPVSAGEVPYHTGLNEECYARNPMPERVY